MTARFIVGGALTVLRSMPDASVDLVLTSPPFLALRSYLPADHPDKALEMGSEATPGEFIDALLDLIEECRRVLAPHGSIAFELGDTYSGRVGRDWPKNPVNPASRAERDGWPLDKSLCLIPELFRFALVYGFNPLTGRETPRWRARNVVRWCRPNPPVGALADKFRPATSDMVIACVGRSRYFDLDAVRTPASDYERVPVARATAPGQRPKACLDTTNAAGAPPLDWWKVSTQPYKGSHYATWPEDLLVRPIKAMCPERVCRACGKASERVTEKAPNYAEVSRSWADATDGREKAAKRERNGHSAQPPGAHITAAEYVTTGWTDCGHGDWRPGVVLDPFTGSGTTLAVAVGHGRDAIGIDLDERNADLARERVGMFLEVETFGAVEVRP